MTANLRDNAVCAVLIAALSDLKIAVRRTCRKDSLVSCWLSVNTLKVVLNLSLKNIFQCLNYLVIGCSTYDLINFRDLFLNLLFIALTKTACNYLSSHLAALAILGKL